MEAKISDVRVKKKKVLVPVMGDIEDINSSVRLLC